MEKVIESKAEIICFQELQSGECENYFSVIFKNMGYNFVYKPRGRYSWQITQSGKDMVDGCGIFYRSDLFELVEDFSFQMREILKNRNDNPNDNQKFDNLFIEDYKVNFFYFFIIFFFFFFLKSFFTFFFS